MAKFFGDKVKILENQTWECYYCPMNSFKSSSDFVKHLRDRHCTKEGGSYVCRYGYNGVCPSLPLDGVNDRDYETHVSKYHINQKPCEPEWSIFSAAQNLAAVLNDPSRGKQANLFTKKWGDSFVDKQHITVVIPQLPAINWNDFELYEKRIGKRYRRHIRIAKNCNHQPDIAKSPIRQLTQITSQQQHQPSHNNSMIKTSSQTNIHDKNIVSNNYNNTNGNLNDIPQIFMKTSLELNNALTFASVFPGIGESNKQSKQSGRLLQEKLSHYLDIVEVHIAKQVSQKSSAFFHAMTSQDTIVSEMNLATKNVKDIRDGLKNIDASVVKDSLRIMLLARTRENYRQILEKLKLMATVQQTQPMIQLLLRTQDYVAALDLICTTQEICFQELIGIHCFRHLPMQLKEMEKLIDKMLSTEFERYATTDLNRPLTNNNNDIEEILEEDKLISIIMGLLREKNFTFIDTYKEETIVAIKAIIKQMVIDVISSSDAELCLTGTGEEAQSLSEISLSEIIELLDRVTVTLMKLLKRCQKVHEVMYQTADASAGKITENLSFIDSETFLTDYDYQIVIDKLNDFIVSVCNYCHERCANLISSQSLEKYVATANEIDRLTHIVNEFSDGSAEVSGVQSFPLKSALKVQAQRFANKFHIERKSKMSLLLDSERWKQVDIPNEFQKIIDRISQNDYTFQTNTNNNNNKSKEISHIATNSIIDLTKTINSNTTTSSPVLLVDNKPYSLVGAALILVQIIAEYCKCAEYLPICCYYLSRHIVDLLRTFNSRSCQLILGAGALHTAGLKTITSGNLALVSRALQLVLWLLPKIKLNFQNLDNTIILNGFDTVEKDYISHINEIEEKVLTIVSTLIINQLQVWDARPPVPSQSFRNISRHFVKLHEAIATILPESQIHQIYRIVHKNFKDKLREQLLKYNIINNGGPQHGTVISELTFYMETLRTLKALPNNELDDKTLEDIWLK